LTRRLCTRGGGGMSGDGLSWRRRGGDPGRRGGCRYGSRSVGGHAGRRGARRNRSSSRSGGGHPGRRGARRNRSRRSHCGRCSDRGGTGFCARRGRLADEDGGRRLGRTPLCAAAAGYEPRSCDTRCLDSRSTTCRARASRRGGSRFSRGTNKFGRRLRRHLGLHRPAQALLISPATDAVGLLLLDARGVALHPDPQLNAQVQGFFVGEAELSSQLVNPDLLRQVLASVPSRVPGYPLVSGYS
jgi:hypothetical protein